MLNKEPHKPVAGALGSTKSLKEKVKKSEQETAKKIGGFVTPGSGAFSGHKGDIKLDKFLLEKKETWAGSILLDRKHLVKIDKEATAVSKYPAMVYQFNKIADGVSKEWVLLPLEVFALMLEKNMDKNL